MWRLSYSVLALVSAWSVLSASAAGRQKTVRQLFSDYDCVIRPYDAGKYKECENRELLADGQRTENEAAAVGKSIEARFTSQAHGGLDDSQQLWKKLGDQICSDSQWPPTDWNGCGVMGDWQRIAFLDWAYAELQPSGHQPAIADPAVDGVGCKAAYAPDWVCSDRELGTAAAHLAATLAAAHPKPSSEVIHAWDQYQAAACANVAALHQTSPSSFPTRQQCLDVLDRQFGELVFILYQPIGGSTAKFKRH